MSRARLAAVALSIFIAAGLLVAPTMASASVPVQTPQVTVSAITQVQNEKVAQKSLGGIWVVGTKFPSPYGSLSGISKSAYNNPGFWPGLCQINKISNCNSIVPGQKIYVPTEPRFAVAPPVLVKPKVVPKPAKTVAVTVSASGRAGSVVAYALAQVGKSYVWAAAGPNAFDCSGLVMAAYSRIGIKLPHQSESLLSYGTPVSKANLRPGDIVWPYHGHVMIYIGNGKVVEAANPSQGVKISSLYAFMTARRLV